MTPAEFRTIGEALRGPRWKAALAKELQCSESAVRFWANGKRPIPVGVPNTLLSLLDRQMEKLTRLRGKILKRTE